MVTKQETQDATDAKRAQQLMGQMTNKDKRAAVAYFDTSFEDLDDLDTLVLLASIADRTKTLEEFDSMPLLDLQEVIRG